VLKLGVGGHNQGQRRLPHLQLLHTPTVILYVPKGHWDPAGVGEVLPGSQANPSSHGPLQLEFVMADTLPNRPAGHKLQLLAPTGLHWPAGQGPLQLALKTPGVVPTYPAAQSVQDAAPAALHCPARHTLAPGLGEPDPDVHA
jgi:hypothetical protein